MSGLFNKQRNGFRVFEFSQPTDCGRRQILPQLLMFLANFSDFGHLCVGKLFQRGSRTRVALPRECPCCRDLDADMIAFHRRNKTVDRIAPDKIRQRELTHVDRIIVDGVRKHGLGFWRVQFGQLFTGRQTHILILPGDRVGQPLNAIGLIGVFGFLLQILECFGANRKLRIVQHLANQNAGPRLLLFGNDFVQHVAANIFVNAAECKSQCRIVAAVILCVQCELESFAANGL